MLSYRKYCDVILGQTVKHSCVNSNSMLCHILVNYLTSLLSVRLRAPTPITFEPTGSILSKLFNFLSLCPPVCPPPLNDLLTNRLNITTALLNIVRKVGGLVLSEFLPLLRQRFAYFGCIQ
jgi:hypothetical protein